MQRSEKKEARQTNDSHNKQANRKNGNPEK